MDVIQRVGRFTLANKLGSRCFGSAAEYGTWANANLGQSVAAASAEWTAAATKCHDYEEEFYSNDDLSYETVASIRGGTQSGTNYFVSGLVKHDNGLQPRTSIASRRCA